MNNPGWLIGVMMLVAALPIMFGLVTAYLKVNIVLGLARNAIGAQQVPSGMIIMALSLSVTLFIMRPVILNSTAALEKIDLQKIQEQKISLVIEALKPAAEPWINFLKKHSGKSEINTLMKMQNDLEQNASKVVDKPSEPDFLVLLTAFILTELKEAFLVGFIVMLPFLVIDLVVANFLAGMGMQMVSPVMISLPIKILLVVGLNAWTLIFKSLFYSYA